jgi:hypothetical protein
MREFSKTLVLIPHTNYYLAKYTLGSVFGIVEGVTQSSSRVHPISDGQLEEIRKRATAVGVEVKIPRSQKELDDLAARGECELTPFEEGLLWDRRSRTSST